MTTSYKIIRALVLSTAFLFVPFIASLFIDGIQWTGSDYVLAWVLVSFLSLSISLAAGSTMPSAYKSAIAVGAIATFLLVWVNGAVGIIGDSEVNLSYGIVAGIVFVGSVLTRLRAHSMVYVMYAAALVQFFIPITAIVINTPDFSPGVFQVLMLNGVWVVLFAASAQMFRHATLEQ